MAEGTGTTPAKNNDNGWSWNSWINAAKNKSTEVLEFVKKDLEELGCAVKNEASNVVTNTTHVLEKTLKLNDSESTASSMKRTFSSFLGQMNTVLNPSPDDSDTEAIVITSDNETLPLTKLQQALYQLQKHSGTFLKDPEQNLAAQYECWLEIINDQLTEDRLAKHLNSSDILKQQYLTLCPEQVSHENFWKRYLFKKALLEDNLAHQEALERRQKREQEQQQEEEQQFKCSSDAGDTFQWEQEDFSNTLDLTEEEQIKLLEQYEHEFKTKQQKIKKIITDKENTPVFSSKLAVERQEEKIANDNNQLDQKSLDLSPTKTPSDVSLSSAETKSSSSSLDGEWECVTPDKII